MRQRRHFSKFNSPIDYAAALERMQGDEAILIELLRLFMQDFYQKLSFLKKGVMEKNFELIQDFGHALKGSSANLSLTALQEASIHLEQAGRKGNIQKAKAMLFLLEQEIKRLKDFLSKLENQKQELRYKKISLQDDCYSESYLEKSEKNSKIRILVADDSVDNQILMKAFTSHTGIEIDTADDGTEAVELFKERKYSLIFLDIHMPEKDGLEVLKEIRSIEKEKALSTTPIIALTGSSYLEEKEKCLSLGFDDYVEKPFEKNKIVQTIHKHLGTLHDAPSSETILIDESIKDLVPHYLKKRRMDIEIMNDALSKHDFSKIESIAHKIKGSGESYGLKSISQVGQLIEKSVQENDHEKIKQSLKKFRCLLDNLRYE